MPSLTESITAAEVILREAWSGDVRLDPVGETLAYHAWPTVIRAHVTTAPRPVDSVIVKTYRSWAPYEPSRPGGPASGLFAEWAALAFLHDRMASEDAVAKLYGGDRALGVIVLQDLGRGCTLDDVLEGNDPVVAETALLDLARTLARVHGASMGGESAYLEMREQLGPTRDRREWLDHVWRSALTTLAELGVDTSGRVRDALHTLRFSMTEPGPWAGLRQSEPGSDNVLIVDDRAKLLDFEGSAWGHVLVDAAFPRMSFGHLPARGRLPDEVVRNFERAYLEELGTLHGWAAVEGPDRLVSAAAWLALECLAACFKVSLDEGRSPYGGARGRAQLVCQWQRAREARPEFSGLADAVLDRLRRAWQLERAPELPIYAAFEGLE